MGAVGKAREGCLAAVGGLLYAPVLGGGGGYFLSRLWDDKGSIGFAGFSAALAVAVYYYGFRLIIKESKERTSRKAVQASGSGNGSSGAAVSSTASTPPSPVAEPNLTALFAPLGRTQGIYEAIRLRAWQLSTHLRAMIDGSAGSATVPGHLVSTCVAYSAVIMFLTQLARNAAWAKSHEFTVVYGQTVLLMQVVLSDRQVDWRRFERLNQAGLQKVRADDDSKRWNAIATADFSDMESAFLHYVDNFGKCPAPDQQMLDVFIKKVGVPEHMRLDVTTVLREFMSESKSEFARLS